MRIKRSNLQFKKTKSNEPFPFPHNRLRDFYRKQAQSFIAQEDRNYSRILAPFPGLDGGAWGHWGQNPESDNVDDRLNEIDFGGVLMQATNHSEGWANKGISVQAGNYTAVFDPENFVLWMPGKADCPNGVPADMA